MSRLTVADLRLAATLSLYRKSFATYAAQQLKLQTKEPGSPIVPFRFNPSQAITDATIERQLATTGKIRLVMHKGRQNGGSAYASGRAFHAVSLFPNTRGLVIAHDDGTASRIFGYSKLFYDSLSPEIQPQSRYSNTQEIVLENPDQRTRARWPGLRSSISFLQAKNATAGTGHTIHFCHLSECAKYGPKAQEMWTSLKPSIPDLPGTAIILESTAWFSGQWFREFGERARSGKSEYAFLFFPWSMTAEYTSPVRDGEMEDLTEDEQGLRAEFGLTLGQLKWRRERIEEQGGDEIAKKLFAQEYPLTVEESWVDLNMGAFDPRALYALSDQVGPAFRIAEIESGPRILDIPMGRLSIWEPPIPGEQYDIGADPSGGKETGDPSVACVMKRRTREQVAEWRGHVGPLDFAEPLYWLGKWYGWAHLGVEVTGVGLGTNERLKEMAYPTLYRWRRYGKIVPEITAHSGWQMTYGSKQHLVTRARHYIAHRDVIIRSPILYQELREFSVRQTDQREYYEGSGAHDDACVAFMLALSIGLDEAAIDGPPARTPPSPPPVPQDYRLVDDWVPGRSSDPITLLAQELQGCP